MAAWGSPSASWPVHWVTFVVVAAKQRSKNERSLRSASGTGRSITAPIPAGTGTAASFFSRFSNPIYSVGKILSWSKRACSVFVNRTRNGRTAAVRSLPTHRFRDWPKTEAAQQQSYRLSKVQDKRTALEALTWTKNKTKCSILFIFQLGKAKENAKLLTCCLEKHKQYLYLQTIVTYDTPGPTTKPDFLKSGDLEALKPRPHSTQMPRGQHRRPQQVFWKRFIGGKWIAVWVRSFPLFQGLHVFSRSTRYPAKECTLWLRECFWIDVERNEDRVQLPSISNRLP